MDKPKSLEYERQNLLRTMSSIDRMRRGTINIQYFKRRLRDGTEVTLGPYYLYSRTEKGVSYSKRLSKEEVGQYQEETENCRCFTKVKLWCIYRGTCRN